MSEISELSITKSLEVHTVYTDFSNTFDRVNHKFLINKLNSLSIQGKLLEWFESDLTDRIRIVHIQ